jgi:hypothetical protein
MLQRTMDDDPQAQDVLARAEGPTVGPDHLLVEGARNDLGRFQFFGGEPEWLQGDDTPRQGYHLIAQLSTRWRAGAERPGRTGEILGSRPYRRRRGPGRA